jgi:hypothetical protein
MKREYKEWGISQNYTVVTFTEFIASLIKDGKLSPEKSEYVFTPQDSPLLARDLEETQPLRDILSACGDICEMLLNKSYTMLAGNFIMAEYLPDVIRTLCAHPFEYLALGQFVAVSARKFAPCFHMVGAIVDNSAVHVENIKLFISDYLDIGVFEVHFFAPFEKNHQYIITPY